MLVTASWGGAEMALEVDAECRSVAALKRCLQEALPEVDVEAVRLEVCGRSVDDESVLGLVDGSVIDVSATQAALAAATLREEGCAVDVSGFWRVARLAAAGDVRLCKLYLEAGVVWPPGVETPLHLAAMGNHRELGMLLLESGCDKEAENNLGNTPLHCAVTNDNVEMARLLLESGCGKEAENNLGSTPLHCAVFNDNVEMARLLLESGCGKEAENNLGSTPLHCAVFNDNVEMARLLLESGCGKEVKNNIGSTPLRCAVANGSVEMARLLLESGCDKEAKGGGGDKSTGSLLEPARRRPP